MLGLMLRGNANRRSARGGKRGFLVTVTVLVTLLALAGPASAQAPCGVSAIDQYVECIPTGDGKNSSSAAGQPAAGGSLPPSVAAQIRSAGGDDAEILEQVASSPNYGAPTKAAGSSTRGRISGEALAAADPDSEVSARDAASAAVSAVQGGDAARLVGLLVAIFLVAVAALTVAALRQKRRASA
jgi:hypothetical protein